MYIQITTRCNMSCEHCCYACGTEGQDMTLDTFKAALALFDGDTEQEVTIGGGEPTLHPDFWQMLFLAVEASDNVFLVTNGSVTESALRLARLARRGVIGCDLSQDYYHDRISDEVIAAFTDGLKREPSYGGGHHYRPANELDGRGIRDVTQGGTNWENLSPFRDPDDGGDPEHCPCGGILIQPDGSVKPCGCRTSPVIGHVSDFDLWGHSSERDDPCGCYKSEETYQNEEDEEDEEDEEEDEL